MMINMMIMIVMMMMTDPCIIRRIFPYIDLIIILSYIIKITGENPEVCSDKRKPREEKEEKKREKKEKTEKWEKKEKKEKKEKR